MKPFHSSTDQDSSKRLIHAKRKYGILYGAVAGFVFAVVAWGIDDYYLSQAHVLYPWLKFAIGVIVCTGFGALAGRLSAQFEKVLIAVLLWLSASALFAWLTIAIPFEIAPRVMVWLKPELKGVLHYTFYPDFQARFIVDLAWVLIFGLFVGLLQLTMTDSAMFSLSSAAKLLPLVVCAILMILAGSRVDDLTNQPLRIALISIDNVIQFANEHQGQNVDPQTAKQMHLGVVSSVEDLIRLPRYLVVSKYDNYLGEIDIAVEFGGTFASCVTVYGQPIFCEKGTPSSP